MKDISTEHTVWCSRCDEWHQEGSRTIKLFIQRILSCGWKSIKGRWVCPECLLAEDRDKSSTTCPRCTGKGCILQPSEIHTGTTVVTCPECYGSGRIK